MVSLRDRLRRRRHAQALSRPTWLAADAPPVSIVMATYNRAELAPESIESVLGQDYPNLELVVVDDGSSDETPGMLAGYAQRHDETRYRFVRQPNGGQASALNWGYKIARGDFIGYMCDDDLLVPGAVSIQASALIDDPKAAIAYSGYRVIDEDGNIEDTVRPIEYMPLDALRLHDTVIGPGGLVRRPALEASGGWITSMKWMADLVLWMDIGLGGPAVRISDPLVSWRRHSGSVTVSLGPDHAREHLTAFERGLALDRLPEVEPSVRDEGLRNACVFGAIFGGQADTWPRERFLVLDLHRKLISSCVSGFTPGTDPDWTEVEDAAALFRQVVDATMRRAGDAPARTGPRPSAYQDALERVRNLGVMAGPGRAFADLVEESRLRLELLEVASSLRPQDPYSSRFFIIDLERTSLTRTQLERLESLSFGSSVAELRAELEALGFDSPDPAGDG